jgi:hypothetical protein
MTLYCPHCGKQLLQEGQRFCAYCAADLSVLGDIQAFGPSSPSTAKPLGAPPTATASAVGGVASSGGSTSSTPLGASSVTPTSPSSAYAAAPPRSGETEMPVIVQVGIAITALATFILPFMTVSATYLGQSASQSVSLLDTIQHSNWTSSPEALLIVGGGVAALVLALLRLSNPAMFSAKVTLIGFAAMAVGYVWILAEWENAVSQITDFYTYLGIGIGQGIGLWAGLAAAVIGGIACLAEGFDFEIEAPTNAGAASVGSGRQDSGTTGKRRCPHCGEWVWQNLRVCPECRGHLAGAWE